MRLVGKEGPADAHDAGRRCGLWEEEAQLMLMMLGVGQRGPADAHDAGCGCGLWEKEAPLMLMMLGVGTARGKKRPG